ncbi:MAG: hypothetical protein K2X80_07485 [Pseudomonadaceae bacterium]|nr:hypothetical protein [Pseudomonadaceae bacterium]
MEVAVRVISRGQEIDRITRPLRMDEGRPAVTYRKLLWPVEDGCIYIETEHDTTLPHRNTDLSDWLELVTRVLPESLPTHIDECVEVLRACFRKNLPHGVIRASASLVSVGLENEARDLLVDFLREKHDSERLSKLIRMQLLFSERSSTQPLPTNTNPSAENTAPEIDTAMSTQEEKTLDWDWVPAEETQKPKIDDQALRKQAECVQETLGAYRTKERGAVISDLAESLSESVWVEELLLPPQGRTPSPGENTLLERTAKLGTIALDILRYFADNPGDRAAHAELVLGYPVADINKLLSGSLSHYLKRDGLGGWACHPWALSVLSALDEVL